MNYSLYVTYAKPAASIRLLFAFLFVLFLASENAWAAEYSLGQETSLTGRFDDNSRLTVGFKDELYGGFLSHRANLARSTERDSLDINLDMDANEYNINAFSTFDYLGSINYQRTNERGFWNIGVSHSRDSTRDSESESDGSGVFDLINTRVENNRLNLGWNHNLNTRNVLNWTLTAVGARYESERRTDYQYGDSGVLWQYIVSERLRLQTNVSYSVLDTDATAGFALNPLVQDQVAAGGLTQTESDNFENICFDGVFSSVVFTIGSFRCFEARQLDNEQSTIRAQLGVFYILHENLSLDLLVGQSTVDTDSEETFLFLPGQGGTIPRVETISSKNDALTYSLNMTYAVDDRRTIELNASSANSVNSNGILVLTTTAGVEGRWPINDKHSIFGRIAWFEQETSSGRAGVFNDRELATMIWRYRYRINKEWSVGAMYRIDEQNRLTQDRKAYSNEWSLTLAWRPTERKWSR